MWKEYDFSDVEYLGVDVADEISAKLSKIYGTKSRRFVQISEDYETLPFADLVITKEVLQHLSHSEVIHILKTVVSFDHIVICNAFFPKRLLPIQIINAIQFKTRLKRLLGGESFLYPSKLQWNNSVIETGDFRGIDLQSAPFSEIFSNH